MTITETITMRGDVEIPVESEILAQKGRYRLVERKDGRALRYAVQAEFGLDMIVNVLQTSDLPQAEKCFSERVGVLRLLRSDA